ncbi:cytochrome P450 [Smaragdicoccus niigatensis]|uniref:cytochrome P450 n=1 Tax=Smaragdicoccus niigatensis TaxID=359359 RepID=UPI000A63CFD5|nr:cytochrome P450 [Smaragdicoccus niigatensis]
MNVRLGARVQHVAAVMAEKYPTRRVPLAAPPAGSGLRPVMGAYGPPGVGYSFNALDGAIGFFRHRYEQYGDVQWFGMFGQRVVAVSGPDALQAVLMDRDHVFSAKEGYGYFIGPFFKGGMLLRDSDEHLYHRRIMQQAFTRPRLVGYLGLTNPGIARALDRWTPRRDFRIYDRVKHLLLDLAAEVFMGTELGARSDLLGKAFEEAVEGGQAIIRANVPGGTWARGLHGRRILANYFEREIPAKRSSPGDDLFSTLCHITSEEGHAFTDQDVIDHMIFLMMAAHDTTSITTSMLAYYLAVHPEWQERLRAESVALGKETLDFDDLDRLPSLDLAFKETLRIHAPVGQFLRKTLRDTEICGHFVPADTLVIGVPYQSMRIDEWWPDPDTFDPGRFAPDRREDQVHRMAWLPFGGGAHKCIGLYFGGMQVKSIMHQMLLRFRWSVRDGYTVPLGWGTGPTPLDGVPIRLERLPR